MIVRLSRTVVHVFVGIGLLAVTGAAYAVDGVIEINAASATAGGVTSGDTAGYPVTISASGTYRLTGNLIVPDGNTTAILITASNVTLDLNGFTIGCQTAGGTPCGPSSPGAIGDGVASTSSSVTNVVVRNGTIANMGHSGTSLYSGRVEDVRAIANGGNGITVSDSSKPGSVVTGCTAQDNGSNGIRCYDYCQITNNVVLHNGGWGVAAVEGVLITGNTISSNTSHGIYITSGNVVGNRISANSGDGVYCAGRCLIADNVVSNSTLIGVAVDGSSLIRNNVIGSNTGLGISITGTGSGYQGNVLNGNNGANPEVSGGTNLQGNLCNGVYCP